MTVESKTWLNIHSYVAAFFLPIAVIYAITGGISALEGQKEHGMRPGFPPPASSGASVQSAPVRGEVANGPAEEPGEAFGPEGPEGKRPGEMKDQGLYGKLLLLHKAKGSLAFSVLGVSFACALLVAYLSGLWMCWGNRKLRGRMLVFAALGLIVTIVILAISP